MDSVSSFTKMKSRTKCFLRSYWYKYSNFGRKRVTRKELMWNKYLSCRQYFFIMRQGKNKWMYTLMFCLLNDYNWILFYSQSLSSSFFWKSLFEVLEWMTAQDSLWQHFPVLASLVWWLLGEKQEGHCRPSLLFLPTMAVMLAKLFRYFIFKAA